MLHLKLYKYTNKPIIVDKTSYLGTALTINGEVPSANQDMENPVVYLASTTELDYNYAYIQEYNRYYYVTRKIWMGGNVWEFTMHVDELYTYKAVVSSISGLVAFSSAGSTMKFDNRLNYNEAPSRAVVSPDASSNLGGTAVLIRYRDARESAPYYYQINSMAYTYMDIDTFGIFMNHYAKLYDPHDNDYNEALAIAIGQAIIDVSVVHYMAFPTTPPVNYFENNVLFTTLSVIKLNNGAPYPISTVEGLAGGKCHTYFVEDQYYPFTPTHLDFSILLAYYWQRIAKRTVFIPYIGNVNVDLSALGLGATNIINLRLDIRHEPAENVYVITPYTETAGVKTYYKEARAVVPTRTTLAFPIDDSFQNYLEIATLKAFSIASRALFAIPAAWVTGGLSLMNAGSLASQVGATMIELDNLKVQDALSSSYKGSTGGDPSSVFWESGSEYDKPVMVVTVTAPASGVSSFQTDHGTPDGAYRSLSSMTGYVQMQEFEMIYNSNATKGEMDRLEQMLYKGVIL